MGTTCLVGGYEPGELRSWPSLSSADIRVFGSAESVADKHCAISEEAMSRSGKQFSPASAPPASTNPLCHALSHENATATRQSRRPQWALESACAGARPRAQDQSHTCKAAPTLNFTQNLEDVCVCGRATTIVAFHVVLQQYSRFYSFELLVLIEFRKSLAVRPTFQY